MKTKMFITTEEELLKLLKEWQERLGLGDWHIGVCLCKPEDIEEGNAGESDVQWVNKCGTISILAKEYFPDDLLIKQPHEEILIHELLHFKFFALKEETREEAYFEMKQHQLLEELAKALYMAKYNLNLGWWANQ